MQDNTMPQAVAKANYVRIAPRKVQIVLDLIRNQPADKALAILKHTPKAACEPLLKLLKSAIANAENKNMDFQSLHQRVHCRSGTDPQENKSERPWQSVQNQQEDVAHHPGAQGSGISEEEVKQWDRKLIPPVLESV